MTSILVDSWTSGSAGAARGTSGSRGAGGSGRDWSGGSGSQVAHFGGCMVGNWRIASSDGRQEAGELRVAMVGRKLENCE